MLPIIDMNIKKKNESLVIGLVCLKDNLKRAMIKLYNETENLNKDRETNWKATEFVAFKEAIETFENLHNLQKEGKIK